MKVSPPVLLSSISAALMLASCGGVNSTPSASNNGLSSTMITGTVPGTLIEAFCKDGSYYSVHSILDGSAQHPFSLKVPSGMDCHLVMTTNEDDPDNKIITPIAIKSGNKVSSIINTQVAFNLGYVPLALNKANIIDANDDGVVDSPLTIEPEVPEGTEIREVTLNVLDKDQDGIPNVYDDDDNDGKYNLEDEDDDNDGVLDDNDEDDHDRDDDGVYDLYDRDDDNDGIHDDEDDDDDNDGIRDDYDEDHDDSHETSSNVSSNYTPVSAYTVAKGRLLVSQCAQCHGTNGQSVNGWDSITGGSSAELIEEMMEFKSGAEDEPIMEAQAHGYSNTEIEALATWLGAQSYSNSSDDDDESEEDKD